ncbi:unnamed protein product [Linum trigynum]|uniref:Myb/SANT-like DNA-binding domain-containing protein n=1 Tax=Linum trigynum TaxID=586398 RepID=A0AAV2GTB7_9ROSI
MEETGERRSMDKEQEESPRRPHPGGGDRLKRDEWSEGAVSSLLEAYESKWVLRNRAKLKGQDWEDVARFVSSRANSTKSPKTQTQCKNKIESMKKRYRSESSAAATDASSSSWPLYHRLHHLLRGAGAAASGAAAPPPAMLPSPRQQRHHPPPLLLMGPSPALLPAVQVVQPQPAPPPPPPQPSLAIPSLQMVPPPPATIGAAAQNSHGPTGVDGVGGKEEDHHGAPDGGKYSAGHASERNTDMSAAAAEEDSDSSTPALVHSDDEKQRKNNKFGKRVKMKRKSSAGGGGARRTTRSEWGMAESIRWLAEVVVRSEQARMDTAREIEKMRMEAEAKRGEMDLKRTEIVANTQLEIAKLFAAGLAKGGPVVDSSLRIGRRNG